MRLTSSKTHLQILTRRTLVSSLTSTISHTCFKKSAGGETLRLRSAGAVTCASAELNDAALQTAAVPLPPSPCRLVTWDQSTYHCFACDIWLALSAAGYNWPRRCQPLAICAQCPPLFKAQNSSRGGAASRQTMTRLLYNKIPKSGSTTMLSILAAMSLKNNYSLDKSPWHYPNKPQLASTVMKNTTAKTAFVGHVNHLVGTPPDYLWINVVRDPIQRLQSLHYYLVDPTRRGYTVAIKEYHVRVKDRSCGCARLEFDDCIRQRSNNNCSLVGYDRYQPSIKAPSTNAFCEPDEQKAGLCTLELALHRLNTRYTAVGITEEMVLTVALFEKMMPKFFSGAFKEYTSRTSLVTRETSKEENPITGTSKSGAVSDVVRRLIIENEPGYKEEMAFYDAVKKLFFKRLCKFGLLG
eukprot:4661250-Pleurochrysis_carterae.AAC.1